jgi:hypothetical protein
MPCLLAGARRGATVEASSASRAAKTMTTLEVTKDAVRAVIDRRPTAIDAIARRVARTRVREASRAGKLDDADVTAKALTETRLAHRVAASAETHFARGGALWTRAGDVARAGARRRQVARLLGGFGVGASATAETGEDADATTRAHVKLVLQTRMLRTLTVAEATSLVVHGSRRVRASKVRAAAACDFVFVFVFHPPRGFNIRSRPLSKLTGARTSSLHGTRLRARCSRSRDTRGAARSS